MNQEECLQIVRASTRSRKYVMVQQAKINHRASLKHNTELATERIWFSIDKVSTSSMKIKPRVYTGSLKCLWRWSCWFCCWLGRCGCFNHLHGGEHTFALIQQPARSERCIMTTFVVWGSSHAISTSFSSHWFRSIGHIDVLRCNQRDVIHWSHVVFWPRDLNAIFASKVGRLSEVVISPIFGPSFLNFRILYFKWILT